MRIIVRAVQSRLNYVDYLRKNLPEAEILFHTTGNAMDTFLKAMIMVGDGPCVHMEDDVIITRDLFKKLELIISERPSEVIQFFSMRGDDIKIGSRYDSGRKFMMNQCFYLPPGYSKMIHDYYPTWPQKEIHKTGYDILIADFLKERKEKYYIHVPSLVQHRVCKSVINPKRPVCRQSKTFVDGIDD
jgi:hypothetical protein